MRYGNEVILRGGRYFDYKRKGASVPKHFLPTKFIWQFTTLGIYAPKDEDADETGYASIGTGNCKELLVSAATEEDAVALLKLELTNHAESYNGSHWNLELVGHDLREVQTSVILRSDYIY